MGKITVLISTTPDGFVDAKNVIIDPEFYEFIHSLMADDDTIAFGRNTFELFQDRWPARLKDEQSPEWVKKMAQSLHDMKKVVFSSTLKTTTWNNSQIIDKLDIDYVNSFKTNNKGGLLTFGSLSIIESLIELNAVDDYYFNILPLIPGKGEDRFFKKLNLNRPQPLKYVEYKQLISGAHVIHYENENINF